MTKTLELCANIESVYSTTPKKMTEPRFSYKITMSNSESLENNDDDLYYGVLQKRMHIILCYENQNNENENYYGLHIGGWLKESLGSVLVEHPILAGRLRRSEDGGLEIVSNDSGVRCVEVQFPLTLEEFLESKEKSNDAEGKLVYWQDIEKSNPQFSPLFYVQVTKFQCGGYSLGISCSLLLSDPSNMAKFLKRWAEVHRRMAGETEVRRTLVNFKDGFSGQEYGLTHVSSTSTTATSKTIIFNISTQQNLNHEIHKHFMLMCLEEAERNIGIKMPSNITLITKEPNGDVKVEFFSKQINFASPKHLKYELTCLSWEDLRMDEFGFHKEKGMVTASLNWTTCDALEGVVISVISSLCEDKSDIKVSITFSSDQEIIY